MSDSSPIPKWSAIILVYFAIAKGVWIYIMYPYSHKSYAIISLALFLAGNLRHVRDEFLKSTPRLIWRTSQEHLCQDGWERGWSVDSRRISEGLSPRWRTFQDACPRNIMSLSLHLKSQDYLCFWPIWHHLITLITQSSYNYTEIGIHGNSNII